MRVRNCSRCVRSERGWGAITYDVCERERDTQNARASKRERERARERETARGRRREREIEREGARGREKRGGESTSERKRARKWEVVLGCSQRQGVVLQTCISTCV